MKTEIFCIFFAALCLAQSSMALKCYVCDNCSKGSREATCGNGEICSKMTFVAQAGGESSESYYKSCVRAGTTCEQQKQEPQVKVALDVFSPILQLGGGSLDAKCDYCSDKDLCNASAVIYPSLALFLSAVAFLFTTY